MRWLVLIFALEILSAQASPSPVLAGESAGEVRFEFTDGLIWVQVEIPGRAKPLHCVFDTGAGMTVLNLEAARELGLSLGRRATVQGTQGRIKARMMDRFRGTLAKISLPGRVLALDLGPVSRLCHRQIDGLIGADFLAAQTVQLDFPAGTLRFGAACAEARAGAYTVRIERRNDALCVPVRPHRSSQLHWVRLDTGYDGGLCLWPGPAGATEVHRDSTLGLAVSGPHSTNLELVIDGTPIRIIESAILRRQMFPNERGLLGNEILSRFRVTIDVPGNRLLLEPQNPRQFN